MLKIYQVNRANAIIEKLKNKEVECPDRLAEGASVILYAIDHLEDKPNLSDWLAGHENYPHFYSQVRYDIEEIVPPVKVKKNPPVKKYIVLLDRRFWLDVLPVWDYSAGYEGRYGNTPGDDVVIKLVNALV